MNSIFDHLCDREETYPTIQNIPDRGKIFLSRLKEDDKRRNTDYEIEYGHWIPDNPLNALVWVILLGSFTQQEIDDFLYFA